MLAALVVVLRSLARPEIDDVDAGFTLDEPRTSGTYTSIRDHTLTAEPADPSTSQGRPEPVEG